MTASVLFAGTWEVLYASWLRESDKLPYEPLRKVICPAATLQGKLVPISLSTLLDPENYTRISPTLFVPRHATGWGVNVIHGYGKYKAFIPMNELRPGMVAELQGEPCVFFYERG